MTQQCSAILKHTYAMSLQVDEDKLQCSQLQEVAQSADLASLPNNAVVLQQHPVNMQHDGPWYNLSFFDTDKHYDAAGATFGQSLQEAGHCGQFGLKGTRCDLEGAHSFWQTLSA